MGGGRSWWGSVAASRTRRGKTCRTSMSVNVRGRVGEWGETERSKRRQRPLNGASVGVDVADLVATGVFALQEIG
jgi:hypothetical protein